MIAHTPDERYAPQLARQFHAELLQHDERVGLLPDWPGETDDGESGQLRLF